MSISFSFKQDIAPLLKLAIPLVLTGFVQSAVWFFETIFLAHLGPDTLAAGSLVSWLFGTLAVILFGALSAINILVAHKHGEKNNESIALIARDGLLMAVLLVIPAILLFWNMSPIFRLFGQPESIVILAKTYLHALSWGMLPNFMAMACLEVIMGLGHARLILVFNMVWVSLNISWSYILIFGKLGFPAFGIAGAGWGMTASSWLAALLLAAFLLGSRHHKIYFRDVFKCVRPIYLLELFQVGLPMGFMFCVEVAFFFALTLSMGLISSRMQAANQVALQYLGLFMSAMFAMAQAVTVRMGHLLGANDNFSAAKVSCIGVGIAVAFTGLVAICYWLFPGIFIAVDFDLSDPANQIIVNEIKALLAVSAVFQMIEGIRITLFGSLRSLKDTRFTLLTSILSFWCIAFPIGYLLAIVLHAGGTGFWWGMVIGASLSVLLLQWRYRRKMNQYLQIAQVKMQSG